MAAETKIAKAKLCLSVSDDITCCFDGVMVEDEAVYQMLPPHSLIQILRPGEELDVTAGTSCSDDTNATSRFDSILTELGKKRKLECPKRTNTNRSYRITVGWFNWSVKEKRFINVRSVKGWGTCSISITVNPTREQIMRYLKDQFFPNGRSSLGKSSKFNFFIGNGKGIPVEGDDFSALKRINLLTKEKQITMYTDSDESDFELPDITFRTRKSKQSAVATIPRPPSPITDEAAVQQGNVAGAAQGTITVQSINHVLSTPSITSPGQFNISTGTPTVTFNPDSLKCCVCFERKCSAFLMPCGHQYCMVCATRLESSSCICAFCRSTINAVGKLQE